MATSAWKLDSNTGGHHLKTVLLTIRLTPMRGDDWWAVELVNAGSYVRLDAGNFQGDLGGAKHHGLSMARLAVQRIMDGLPAD